MEAIFYLHAHMLWAAIEPRTCSRSTDNLVLMCTDSSENWPNVLCSLSEALAFLSGVED